MHGRIKPMPQPEEKKKKPQRGFDKLVNSGISLEEIEIMRLQYHRPKHYANEEEKWEAEDLWISQRIENNNNDPDFMGPNNIIRIEERNP